MNLKICFLTDINTYKASKSFVVFCSYSLKYKQIVNFLHLNLYFRMKKSCGGERTNNFYPRITEYDKSE